MREGGYEGDYLRRPPPCEQTLGNRQVAGGGCHRHTWGAGAGRGAGRPSRPGVGTATLLLSTRANFHQPLCSARQHWPSAPSSQPLGTQRKQRGRGDAGRKSQGLAPGGCGRLAPRRPRPAPNPSRTRLLQPSRPPVQRCPPHAPPDLLQGCTSCPRVSSLQTPHQHPGTWLGDRASGRGGTHAALMLATVRRRTWVPAFRGIKSPDRV